MKNHDEIICDLATIRSRNDNANATRFIDQYVDRLRYVTSWRLWLFWDGRRWKIDQSEAMVFFYARQFANSLWNEAAKVLKDTSTSSDDKLAVTNFAKSSNDSRRINSLVLLGKSDPRITISHEELNADPYLLNLRNCTYCLKSGTAYEHQREDQLTQLAGVIYDKDAKCPLWLETLNHVFAGNADLIAYIQTLLGYSLVGITDEHILPVCYGEGNNGKSTIWNAIHDILGDYAGLVTQDLLLPNKNQHPTEVADLFGRRFVAVSEPEQGRKLAESKVKDMTGDRVLKGRRMREDFWEFPPTHMFWLSTNHKPSITGTDQGIWRRVKLIPFTVDLSEVVQIDKAFPDKLKAEYSGILNWLIEGWNRYQEYGLVEPEVVTEATAEYRNSEDIIGQFLRETYVENSAFIIGATEAYNSFKDRGGKMTQTEFGSEMAKRYKKTRHTAGKYRNKWIYEGIGLLD